ncbi:hypothetical protein M9H77_21103 [Catharanthus roseus]|uniref:Uncharacterized protein n=1 Tax=Catharanthus roseus TaxID=4058 RepID=A0ACC0ALM5_CATRO|nr:hypothetical protein M9H77_21103 [Catharanthus roseus]
MLATQSSSTKCLPYGCFLTKVFQYFILNLVGVGDPIGAGKIYNKYTFKRIGFERNEEGMLVRGGQDRSDEDSKDDEGDEEQEENLRKRLIKREMRQNKRRERAEEGLSSGGVSQIMDMIASLQAFMNSYFDALDGCFEALDGKVYNIQERFYIEEQKMHKRSLNGNLHRSKISLKTTRVYEHEVVKLNTLKTRRLKISLELNFLSSFKEGEKEELVEINIVLYLPLLKLIW